MLPGIGTAVNVVAVLVGTTLGVLLGDRLPERTRAWSPTGWAWSPC